MSASYYLCLNLCCMGMAGYGCGYGHDNDGNVLNYGDHQDAGITGRNEWKMIEHPCNCGLN